MGMSGTPPNGISFNSIEWIPVLTFLAVIVAYRPFNSIEWIRWFGVAQDCYTLTFLSIPLNGFIGEEKLGVPPGLSAPFNSIEWILEFQKKYFSDEFTSLFQFH